MSYTRLLIFLLVAAYSIPAAALSGAPLFGVVMAIVQYGHWSKLLIFPFALCSALSWVILIWLSLNWIFGRKLKRFWPNFGFTTALIGIAPIVALAAAAGFSLFVLTALFTGPAMILAFHVCAWHKSTDKRPI